MSDQTPTDTAKQEPQEQFLYAFNDKGQRVRFSREQWAKHVIPQNVKLHWKNPDALFALLQQAAEQNNAEAMLTLAQAYRLGVGVVVSSHIRRTRVAGSVNGFRFRGGCLAEAGRRRRGSQGHDR